MFWCSVLMIMSFTDLSIVNPKVEKHLRTTTEIEEKQPPIVVPPYHMGPTHVFPMGTMMMLINTNIMVTLSMPIWNLMMYSMTRGVCPLVSTIQVHVIVHVPINA